MSHSYHKIWLHYIWATKSRQPLITKELKPVLIQHIRDYGKSNDIYVDIVNGDMDHLHSLVSLKPTQAPAEVINKLKGESSNWVNKTEYLSVKFAWQNGYSVFSVSASNVKKVREYIKTQEQHHTKMTCLEEAERSLNACGLDK